MIDKNIHPIDGIDLTGKTILLKSWQKEGWPQKPWRHLIRKVQGIDESLEYPETYIDLKPIGVPWNHIYERFPRSAIEGIISEEYAEQLLMWDLLHGN